MSKSCVFSVDFHSARDATPTARNCLAAGVGAVYRGGASQCQTRISRDFLFFLSRCRYVLLRENPAKHSHIVWVRRASLSTDRAGACARFGVQRAAPRNFIHRISPVTEKPGNPLTESPPSGPKIAPGPAPLRPAIDDRLPAIPPVSRLRCAEGALNVLNPLTIRYFLPRAAGFRGAAGGWTGVSPPGRRRSGRGDRSGPPPGKRPPGISCRYCVRRNGLWCALR
jgi:hypothetical protein